jgi:putative membrane protein
MILFLGIAGMNMVLSQIPSLHISSTAVMLSIILLFFLIVIIHGWKTLGARGFLVFLLMAYCIPLLYEYTDALGFGGLVQCTSSYTDVLGLKFLDKVPYVIPLVWSILLYCSFTMTNIIFHRIRKTPTFEEIASLRWIGKIIGMGFVMGVIMASLDLIIDPVMVAMGAWSWSVHGSYYGIPLWNYVGWVEISAVTFICYSIYLLVSKKSQVYIGKENPSRYTLFVVFLYLASLGIYVVYSVKVQVSFVVPWAVMTTGFFACIVVIQFYRSYVKEGKDGSLLRSH